MIQKFTPQHYKSRQGAAFYLVDAPDHYLVVDISKIDNRDFVKKFGKVTSTEDRIKKLFSDEEFFESSSEKEFQNALKEYADFGERIQIKLILQA